MPDGEVRNVQPFHVSCEGLEKSIICRDDEDYDAVVKMLCVCAHRKNVIIVIYAVVSNHVHVAVLALSQQQANAYADEVKRMIGMWVKRRYGIKNLMKQVDAKALPMESFWHIRNALAYIPRNALDNGCNVNTYPWSGYRAMFSQKPTTGKQVSQLTKRDKASLMHTCDDLSDIPWLLDADNHLIPESFCDSRYLEEAFENDQAFFLKTIGALDAAQMKEILIDSPRKWKTDSALFQLVDDTARHWFGAGVETIPSEKKWRLLSYTFRTNHTTHTQLARVFGLPRDEVEAALRLLQHKKSPQ